MSNIPLSVTRRSGFAGNSDTGIDIESNFTAGSFAVLIIETQTNTPTGVTDTDGNTWTSIGSFANTLNVGSRISWYYCGSVALTTADTISVSFGEGNTPISCVLYEILGNNVTYISWGTNSNGSANTTPTVTSSSITSGDVIIGAMGIQSGSAITADSDTTNGSWSSAIEEGPSGRRIYSQYKITTGTGTQTYNVSTGNNYWVASWAQFRES